MKKTLLCLLAREFLREMTDHDREPSRMLVFPLRDSNGKRIPVVLRGKKTDGNATYAKPPSVEEIAECAYALLRNPLRKNDVWKGGKNHLKISREAWDKLLKLRKGDIAAFIHEFQNRRLHRVHAPAA